MQQHTGGHLPLIQVDDCSNALSCLPVASIDLVNKTQNNLKWMLRRIPILLLLLLLLLRSISRA